MQYGAEFAQAQEFMLQIFLHINQRLYTKGCITEAVYAAAKEYIISEKSYAL